MHAPEPSPKQLAQSATNQTPESSPTPGPSRPGKLIRLPLVEDRTGLGKSSIYAAVKAGTMPAPVRLSARAVAWREEEIDQWIAARTAAR